jgi:hypothetical protein
MNEDLYDDLLMYDLINTKGCKYIPEHYIKENYSVINKILMNEKYSSLVKQNIVKPYNKFFTEIKIHDVILFNVDIENPTVRGTIIDGALSYLYDDTINLFEYVNECSDVNLQKLIKDGKITGSKTAISEIFGDQLIRVKNKLDSIYTDIKPNMIAYNHKLKSYGNPDLVGDKVVLDIKTSKNKIINPSNYLQVLSYGVLMNINKVCIYDIINGLIYEGVIENSDKIRQLIISRADENMEMNDVMKNMKTYGYKMSNYLKNEWMNDFD